VKPGREEFLLDSLLPHECGVPLCRDALGSLGKLSVIERERAVGYSLPPWDSGGDPDQSENGLIPMRSAEEAVIVLVQHFLNRLDRLPCRTAAGNSARMVSRPPGIRRGDGGGYATTVVSNQDIQLCRNQLTEKCPAFVPGGAAFDVLDGRSFCVGDAADDDLVGRPRIRFKQSTKSICKAPHCCIQFPHLSFQYSTVSCKAQICCLSLVFSFLSCSSAARS
jgi:hypothetical protein